MSIQASTKVHVDLRVDGKDYTGSYGPGDQLPAAVADLLIAQGLAAETSDKKKATDQAAKTDTNPSEA